MQEIHEEKRLILKHYRLLLDQNEVAISTARVADNTYSDIEFSEGKEDVPITASGANLDPRPGWLRLPV